MTKLRYKRHFWSGSRSGAVSRYSCWSLTNGWNGQDAWIDYKSGSGSFNKETSTSGKRYSY